MIEKMSIDELIKASDRRPIVDVRTPAEFAHGHIPGAFNIPLFTNEERARVGTLYKHEGREAAILLGFDLTGDKWSDYIRQALGIAPQKKIAMHCWRGGMRSEAMAWALSLYGFEVTLLRGGYKDYRNRVLTEMNKSWDLRVVGGMTGSGKTDVLQNLRQMGEQVIDLEELAQHRGSTYGTLNRLVQPSQEQFENDLAEQLRNMDPNHRIWVEDESISIGKRLIPKSFWDQMYAAVVYDLQVPLQQRVEALVQQYGTLDATFLIDCTERIRKRLGPEQTKRAVAAIKENNMEEFVRQVLIYYDKAYRTGLDPRNQRRIAVMRDCNRNPSEAAIQLIKHANTHRSVLASIKNIER